MDLLQEWYTGICLPPHLTHSPPHSLLPLQTVVVGRSSRRPQGQDPGKASEDPQGRTLMVQILQTRVGSACHFSLQGTRTLTADEEPPIIRPSGFKEESTLQSQVTSIARKGHRGEAGSPHRLGSAGWRWSRVERQSTACTGS